MYRIKFEQVRCTLHGGEIIDVDDGELVGAGVEGDPHSQTAYK